MKKIIEGASVLRTVRVKKADGSFENISGWPVVAAWLGAPAPAPEPTITAPDATTQLVLIGSNGLGGMVLTLRWSIQDPVSGEVLLEDEQFIIKA